MPIHTRKGVTIYAIGSEFFCSDGKRYRYRGFALEGPNGIISMRIKSIKIAEDTLCDIYGGRMDWISDIIRQPRSIPPVCGRIVLKYMYEIII